MRYSDAYVEHLSRGPFEGKVDPWAEAAQYFHQIHGCIIGDLLERLRVPLLKRGYVASRETSLQLLEHSQPENVPELEAIFIHQMDKSGTLVTIIEVVSPENKTDDAKIQECLERNNQFVQYRDINIVEMDLTRSVKRLLSYQTASPCPYHISITMPSKAPYFVGARYGEALHSFALPLDHEFIPVDTQQVYEVAYRQASIAPQIERQGDYVLSKLPFPSLLTDGEKQWAMEQVQRWQTQLNTLKSEN